MVRMGGEQGQGSGVSKVCSARGGRSCVMQGVAGWTAGGAPVSGDPGGLDSGGYRHKVGVRED